MAFVQFVVVLILGLLTLTSMGYQPDLYPGPCPNIPSPNNNFQEDFITGFWFNTLFSNPSLDLTCAYTGIKRTPYGVDFLTKSFNRSGDHANYLAIMTRTPSPGVYDFQVFTNRGRVVTGKQMFYFYEEMNGSVCKEYLLIWACVNRPAEMRHYEEYEVLSKTKIDPLPAAKVFRDYLNRSGSPIRGLLNVVENRCCWPGFGTSIPLRC